jgi:aspartokinase-like uncharacterized kinase
MRSSGEWLTHGREHRSELHLGETACDVFIKIGGSILDRDDLTALLVPHVVALSPEHRIMILTGGGQSVKRIKSSQKRYETDFYSCWVPAVLCLDVNAGILASYSKTFEVVASAAQISACFSQGRVAVFAAAAAIFHSLHLTPDFRTTTDSMGLYFANALGARRYVIVSDVNGIFSNKPQQGYDGAPIARLTLDELELLTSSKLDPSFPAYFRRFATPTYIVNGRFPERVGAAIRGEMTVGTEIAIPSGKL